MDLTFVTVLTIGFLGSTHCVGMCGGIVGALNTPARESVRRSGLAAALHHASYNSGRIASYVVAGGLAGLIGSQAQRLPMATALPVGAMIAAMFMVALGLYLGGWWQAIAGLENLGRRAWRWVQPLGRRLLPARNPLQAFGLGLVWGWLPCGLVYSALALAMISGDPARGALLMLGFGLGTLPTLLVMGGAASQLKRLMQFQAVRRWAGALIIFFGVYTGYTAGTAAHHHVGVDRSALAGDVDPSLDAAVSLLFSDICWTPGYRLD